MADEEKKVFEYVLSDLLALDAPALEAAAYEMSMEQLDRAIIDFDNMEASRASRKLLTQVWDHRSDIERMEKALNRPLTDEQKAAMKPAQTIGLMGIKNESQATPKKD